MKVITATLASLSLALGLAAPTGASAADGEDIAKILAGIATIAVIAEIADRKRDRDREATVEVDQRRVWRLDDGTDRARRYEDRQTFGRMIEDRRYAKTRGYQKVPLPAQCERLVETRRGDRLVYGARCLDRRYKHARHLPEHCLVRVDTRRGERLAYGARCLSRDGWRVAHR